jgi:uncharacterized protein YfaA (DUF2138 family)
MCDQMTHIAALARRPNISVQVLSRQGAHVGLMGAFAMAETTDVLVVHLEHIAEGLTTDTPAIVAQANLRFDLLKSDAYRRSDSLALIEERVEKWKS